VKLFSVLELQVFTTIQLNKVCFHNLTGELIFTDGIDKEVLQLSRGAAASQPFDLSDLEIVTPVNEQEIINQGRRDLLAEKEKTAS
jgi:hypothetical protein